ncbi:MFS family permease [Allocatelliglobosispora scoriae]|uniref:MFS family permease n=1 Tax=Allocatelliglobosispora scoriae TaxID=643052 RepID=A0A841C2B8_9ACTN|nr:MFS transporter [Allocatelliglobosispora scoriae]MBB5873283.1 MFS family permease [Allocatelliglobosispora scoriae]
MTTLPAPVPEARNWRQGRTGLIGLIATEAIASIGSRMTFLAIPWLVLITTGSPVKVGLVTGAETLAYVVSGVLAAPLQDRIGARLTSIGADLLSVFAMGAIAIFARAPFGVMLTLVAIAGMLRAQADRSKNNLLLPQMEAAKTDFTRVAASREGILKSAMLVGAGLAGVTIAAFGGVGAIWFDAATFALSSAMITLLVPRNIPPKLDADGNEIVKPKPEPYFTALRNGWAGFKQDRLLRAATGMFFFTNLFNQASAVVFVPLWVLTYMPDATALGAVGAAYAVGIIIGNLLFAWLAPVLPRYPVLVAGYFIGGAPRFLVLALTDNLTVIVAVTLVSGIAMCSVNPTIGAMIFQRVPKEMLARVGGIITAVAYGGIPLGGILGGVLVSQLGLVNGILAGTALYFIVTLAPVAGYRTWRELNDVHSKKPTADGLTALPQLYAVGGAAAGPRLTLHYSKGVWTMRARHGLRVLVRRQRVQPKIAVNALTQINVEPVQEALREALGHDQVLAQRQYRRVRTAADRAEAALAEITIALERR